MSAAEESEFLRLLRSRLAGREPGHHGDVELPLETLRPASVLVGLYEEGGEPGLLLTRRAASLGKHAGQIAFPGGGRDAGEDEIACALREAREEIALPDTEAEVLGQLDRYTTITSYLVTPVVAKLPRWPLQLTPDPHEVESILAVPIASLIAPGVLRAAERPGTGRWINFFDVGEDVIWGATAAMVRQLLELTLGAPLRPEGEVPWEKVRW